METDRCTATATNRIYPARCTRTAGHEGRHTFGNAAGDPLAERAFDTVRCSEGCAFRKGFCQDHEVVLFQPEPSRAP